MGKTDYPQGDGHPDCPLCKGRGVVPIPEEDKPPWLRGPATRYCTCTVKRDLMANLSRGWKPLTKVLSVSKTPLRGKERQNLWITAPLDDLKSHIRAVAVRQSPRWLFKVITDIDLMTTWLYSANEVLDADVDVARKRGENKESRITDLVEPYDLIIIRVGVKSSRNNATAEVFLEALLHREQLGLATWIVDSPGWPLQQGHLAWDIRVAEFLEAWEHISLGEEDSITTQGRFKDIGLDTPKIQTRARTPSPPPPPSSNFDKYVTSDVLGTSKSKKRRGR